MNEEAAHPDTSRWSPRWIWIALIVSLGLNLLVAGVIGAAYWQLTYAAGTGPQPGGRLAAFSRTLPEERGAELRRMASNLQPAIRPLRREVRRARREAARLFTSDPFDRAAFLDAYARLLVSEQRLREGYRDMLAELGANLTADERRSFVEWGRRHGRFGQRSIDEDEGGGTDAVSDRQRP
jgi:uncharacterized membrane protein